MPLFCCSKCGCVENTAVSNYWSAADKKAALCSECDQAIGQWHGRFPKRSAAGMLIDQNGHLWSRESVEAGQLPSSYQIVGEVGKQLDTTPPEPEDLLLNCPERSELAPVNEPERNEKPQEGSMNNRTKRTWAYLQPPKAFEVAPCDCGNVDTQWSEFEGHCWCESCQKDFKPAHGGVFDGPIPIKTAALLGLRFDRVILATQQVERFDVNSGEYRPA